MSELDLNEPEVQEAIAAQAAEQAKSLVAKQMEDFVPKSEVEGLVNKKDELLGKLHEFKGITKDDVAQLMALKEQAQTNEVARLASEGKFDEIKAIGAKQYMEQAATDQAELNRQLEAAQNSYAETVAALESKDGEIEFLYKETFLKDLLGSDDSFKKGKESQFMKVYGDQIQFDRDTRTFYALNSDNERVIDVEGNHVKFSDYVKTNIKKNDDLFFSAGSGSGFKSNGSVNGHGKKFSQLSFAEKNELRKELGDAEYQRFAQSGA